VIILISAVIVAGGRGTRMGKDISKQYIKIQGSEILARTLDVFEACLSVDEIILVVSVDDVQYCISEITGKYDFRKVKSIVPGGKERQESVYNGLINCSSETDIVIIHDAVRPFVNTMIIEKSIESAQKHGACTAAVPVKDTIKIVDKEGFSIETPDRSTLYSVQTPQTFKYDLILSAHQKAMAESKRGTDDTMLVEMLGHKVHIIDGSYYNIKITSPEDLILAEAIINSSER
jgi:2-C-methyl-D-erythritol 4-phosphate cytidylyltransferase